MARGKAEIWGRRSYVEELIAPRPITRLALAGTSAAIGYAFWAKFDIQIISAASAVSASFCLLCASAVWAMRDKPDSVLLGDHLNAVEFRNTFLASSSIRTRSTWRAAFVGLCALAAGGPAIAAQLAGAVWQWMILACSLGVSEAAYSFLLVNAWDEQLRVKRAADIEKAKRKKESDAEISRLSAQSPSHAASSQWAVSSQPLDPPEIYH